MSDWSEAAVIAAQLLDDLEEEYGDEIKVGRICVVVEVSGDLGTDEEWTGVHFRSNEHTRWIQAGLLSAAERAVHLSSEERGE